MSAALIAKRIPLGEQQQRAADILARYLRADRKMTDRLFAGLLIVQWIAGIGVAMFLTPYTWAGTTAEVHLHVKVAIFLGAALTLFPAYLALALPGEAVTRHVIAVAQMLWSGLLIHLTGGRIETHFHVFGSLAFLAFYRDGKVILTATLVAVADHLLRSVWWPYSVFGLDQPALWRTLEHGMWVLFEDVFLLISIRQRVGELQAIAAREAWQDEVHAWTEKEIQARTRELTAKSAELEAMNDASPLGMFRTDAAGANTYVNPMYARITGMSSAVAQGLAWHKLVHPDDLAEVVRLWTAAVGASAMYSHKHRIIRPDGRVTWISVHAAPMRDHGVVTGYIGTVQDVTTHHETEEKLRLASEAAQAASAAKSRFLANMSHELRTPMTAILGFIEILANNLRDSDDLHAAQTIKRNADYLLSLINDVLDLSKIESGKLDIEQSEVSLPTLLSEIRSLMSVRAATKNLSLSVEFASQIPATIQADPLRLRQVLVNLLGNAIKFTEVGFVRVVAQVEGSQQLRIDIIDSGIGMSAEQLSRLFQPFQQADNSITRRYGGTGLGLTISKRLVDLMQGSIEVQTSLGHGSKFSVTLPLDELAVTRLVDADALLQQQIEPTPGVSTVQRLRARILLAEDGPDNRRLLEFVLRKAGAEITSVENGQLAVAAVIEQSRTDAPFDVVLMDMHMPVLDGYSATRQLRELGYDLPIIALTAHAMHNDRELCLQAGCTDYMSKPIARDPLVALVQRYAGAQTTGV